MPLSYHWNSNSLQIVCQGSVHLLCADDARYPWALAALSQSEQAVVNILAGDVPVFPEQNVPWLVQALEEGQDPTDANAWETVDEFDDCVRACTLAGEYLLLNGTAQDVRVLNEAGLEVYRLSRSIALAQH